jgi:hypothetical protein
VTGFHVVADPSISPVVTTGEARDAFPAPTLQ